MKTQRLQERIIDAIGSAVVAACAIGFFWSITKGSESTRGEIAQLGQAIERDSGAERLLTDGLARLNEELAQRREALNESGQLPVHAPVDAYFQMLSAEAIGHRLRVMRHHPVSQRTYPGLLEQCYIFEVAGTTRSLVQFLETIERTDFWADVSYLAIDGSSRAVNTGVMEADGSGAVRQATLTISLFSAPDSDFSGNSAKDP